MKMIMTINIDDDGEVEGKLGAEMMMESVWSVRSCLLISLIKCVNGHKGLLFHCVLSMLLNLVFLLESLYPLTSCESQRSLSVFPKCVCLCL